VLVHCSQASNTVQGGGHRELRLLSGGGTQVAAAVAGMLQLVGRMPLASRGVWGCGHLGLGASCRTGTAECLHKPVKYSWLKQQGACRTGGNRYQAAYAGTT
jgi:hypothetical protein